MDKYNFPNMRDDGNIKETEKYIIAEYESRGLRLEELANRLTSKINSHFILYDYKGTISTDNDEVLELLKEMYPSGDYECFMSKDSLERDNLIIIYDEILSLQSDGSFNWIKYVPKWNIVYRKIAEKLFELTQNPFNKKSVGELLYDKCFGDKEFVENNDWIKKFDSWNIHSLDPIHIFASINSSQLGNKRRINRINILFRLLDSNFKRTDNYSSINFEGCPSPMSVKTITARNENNQKEVWQYFIEVFKNSQNISIDFNKVKNWYGIRIKIFTIFLFWIDAKNFLPLDGNTISFLENNKKMNSFPENYEDYKKLLTKSNSNIYKTISLISFDFSKLDVLNQFDRRELDEYLSDSQQNVSIPLIGSQANLQMGQVKVTVKDKSKFKLIAIKPLKKCDSKYLKTLKENELYIFDKAYSIYEDKINVDEIKSLSLYGQKINIHAIVGKNGTGKSTLVELLFAVINTIAKYKNINKDIVDVDMGLKVELYFETDIIYKMVVDNKNIELFKYEKKDDTFYLDIETIDLSDFELKNLFYTIAVNYSQHSLNSLYMGEWLNSLFHKNDAYQTPIVIEPFRKNGNIDVNKQTELLSQRLLANILRFEDDINNKESFKQITEYYKARVLKFSINENKFKYVYKNKDEKEVLFEELINLENILLPILYQKFEINDIEFELKDYAKKYILKKVISIALTYEHYKKFFIQKHKIIKKPSRYINKLYKDQSHITYKLKQAINFMKYEELRYSTNKNNDYIVTSVCNIIQNIRMNNSDNTIHRYLPPSFYKVDVILDNGIELSSLSSGEKQKIHSINSILYQLNNIASVMENSNLIKYRNVNIILDEIELYFHPELQRQYVSELHNAISKTDFDEISNINICFVTHSPFILSDIPDSKILFLNKDSLNINAKTFSAKGSKTFGANIHELLVNGFFIDNSMGKFAQEKINEIIKFYGKVINSTNDSFEELKKEYSARKDKFYFILEHIGEDYISGVVKSHIEEIELKLNENNFKETRIKQLKEELKLLGVEVNDIN